MNLMLRNPQRILVLYWYPGFGKMRAAIQYHLKALEYSDVKHDIIYYNALFGIPSWLIYLNFDVLILHNTFLCLRHSRLFEVWKWQMKWIKNVNCLKMAIPQDEYDYAEILDDWLYEWNISVIFTNFDQEKQKILYPKMYNKAVFYQCLTGYIDDVVAQQYAHSLTPIKDRKYDIVYRASHLPYRFGKHGQLKHQIAKIVSDSAERLGLNSNISTLDKDTILGDKWFDFLASGKTVIGCESGSSVLDRRGEIKTKIETILKNNNNISFQEITHFLPPDWDNYQFFAISPRHFEAIITKTCQILVEGNYDHILEPNRHYIAIKKDFSNLDEVIGKIKDDKYITEITELAYNEIYLSGKYSYKTFCILIDNAIFSHKEKQINRRLINNKWLLKIYSFIIRMNNLLEIFFYFITIELIKKVYNYMKN